MTTPIGVFNYYPYAQMASQNDLFLEQVVTALTSKGASDTVISSVKDFFMDHGNVVSWLEALKQFIMNTKAEILTSEEVELVCETANEIIEDQDGEDPIDSANDGMNPVLSSTDPVEVSVDNAPETQIDPVDAAVSTDSSPAVSQAQATFEEDGEAEESNHVETQDLQDAE